MVVQIVLSSHLNIDLGRINHPFLLLRRFIITAKKKCHFEYKDAKEYIKAGLFFATFFQDFDRYCNCKITGCSLTENLIWPFLCTAVYEKKVFT
jgi:hypothetical protein